MRLTADTIVGGRPAREIRLLLRRMQMGGTTPGRLAEDAGLDDDETVELVCKLIDEGVLAASGDDVIRLAAGDRDRDQRLTERLDLPPTRLGSGAVQLTTHGHAVANASFGRPVKRATAQRHLEAFLKRVERLNADPESRATVEGAWLFGSFLDPDVDPVGDVDLILDVAPRGDQVSIDEVVEAWKQLKGGSAVISLHGREHLDLDGVVTRRIYPTAA